MKLHPHIHSLTPPHSTTNTVQASSLHLPIPLSSTRKRHTLQPPRIPTTCCCTSSRAVASCVLRSLEAVASNLAWVPYDQKMYRFKGRASSG